MENNFFEEKDLSPKSTTFFIYDAFDYKDRAFKQVSFSIPTAIDKNKIKIKLVTTEGLEKEINSKKIKIPDTFGYTGIPKFRVKTINQPSLLFISEEDLLWVEQETKSKEKIEINQFRIMAVSNPEKTKNHKWKSDWIYSNIKNINNETIIYELINELMDLIILEKEKDVTLNAFLESSITNLSLEEQLHIFLWIKEFDKYQGNIKENIKPSLLLYIKDFFVSCILEKDLNVLLNIYLDTEKLNYKAFDKKPEMHIKKLIPEYIDLFKHVREVLKINVPKKILDEKVKLGFKFKTTNNDFKLKIGEEKINLYEKEEINFEENKVKMKEDLSINKKEEILKDNKKIKLKELKKLNVKEKTIKENIKFKMQETKKVYILEKIKTQNEFIDLKEVKNTEKKEYLKSKNEKLLFLENKKTNLKDKSKINKNENIKQIERFTAERNEKIYNIIDKKLIEFYNAQKDMKEKAPVIYEKEEGTVVLGNFLLGVNNI